MDFPKIELKILEKLKMSNRTHHICLVDDKGNIESIITLGKDTELDKYASESDMKINHIRNRLRAKLEKRKKT